MWQFLRVAGKSLWTAVSCQDDRYQGSKLMHGAYYGIPAVFTRLQSKAFRSVPTTKNCEEDSHQSILRPKAEAASEVGKSGRGRADIPIFSDCAHAGGRGIMTVRASVQRLRQAQH